PELDTAYQHPRFLEKCESELAFLPRQSSLCFLHLSLLSDELLPLPIPAHRERWPHELASRILSRVPRSSRTLPCLRRRRDRRAGIEIDTPDFRDHGSL